VCMYSKACVCTQNCAYVQVCLCTQKRCCAVPSRLTPDENWYMNYFAQFVAQQSYLKCVLFKVCLCVCIEWYAHSSSAQNVHHAFCSIYLMVNTHKV